MTLTFKQFTQLIDLTDEEFIQVEEGLSDVPGFGWLKGKDNSVKLAKIDAERVKLQRLKTAKAKALDAQFAQAKSAIENGSKQKAGVVSNDEFDAALSADDRRINARADKSNTNLAHRQRNLAN
jgi:hypothetical protein